MKKSRFTNEQIIVIKRVDARMGGAELCRQRGFSQASFYRWRAKYGCMEAEHAKCVKELESENGRFKRLLAEPTWTLRRSRSGLG